MFCSFYSKDSIEDVCIVEEINDNEEVLFELDECLHTKTTALNDLKQQVTNLENDIRRHTTPYNIQKSTLENDVNMFRAVASKYVKSELIEFYVDRMLKNADKKGSRAESTISALCQTISEEEK